MKLYSIEQYVKPHEDWAEQIVVGSPSSVRSALFARIEAGHVYFVDALLEKSPQSAIDQIALTEHALQHEQFLLFPIFAKHKFDFNLVKMDDPLFPDRSVNVLERCFDKASSFGDLETVQTIIKNKLITDKKVMTWAANSACMCDQIEVLKFFFDQGVNPDDMRTFTGQTFDFCHQYKEVLKQRQERLAEERQKMFQRLSNAPCHARPKRRPKPPRT